MQVEAKVACNLLVAMAMMPAWYQQQPSAIHPWNSIHYCLVHCPPIIPGVLSFSRLASDDSNHVDYHELKKTLLSTWSSVKCFMYSMPLDPSDNMARWAWPCLFCR